MPSVWAYSFVRRDSMQAGKLLPEGFGAFVTLLLFITFAQNCATYIAETCFDPVFGLRYAMKLLKETDG